MCGPTEAACMPSLQVGYSVEYDYTDDSTPGVRH